MLDIWQCTSTRSIVGCRNVEVFSVSRNQRQYISWCGYCCGRVTVTLIGSHPAPDLLMVKYKRSWVLSPPLFTKCQLDKYFSSISFTQFIFSVEICTQIGPLCDSSRPWRAADKLDVVLIVNGKNIKFSWVWWHHTALLCTLGAIISNTRIRQIIASSSSKVLQRQCLCSKCELFSL